jgi:hypothetical protein
MEARLFLIVGALACAPLSLSRIASGREPTKDECMDANELAQTLARAGKLRAARGHLLVCMASSCPGPVREDCASRLNEVQKALPTIVFEAKAPNGMDVVAVRVEMDGDRLVDRLDGTALTVDPGEHAFAFKVAGKPTVARRLVLVEGEKDRRERVIVGDSVPPSDRGPRTQLPSSPPSPQASAWPQPLGPIHGTGISRETIALAVGGAGIVGLAVGSVFGLIASQNWTASQKECHSPATPPNCPAHEQAVTDQRSTVTNGAISTVGFIAGGALLAGGIALWLTAPSESKASGPSAVTIHVAPRIGQGTTALAVTGEF